MASISIWDGWVTRLRKSLATTGYIITTIKLEMEKPNLILAEPVGNPPDISSRDSPFRDEHAPAPFPWS